MDPGGATSLYWIYLLAGGLTILLTGTVIAVVILNQRRQMEQSRRFSQGLVEAQDAERARIARELHDDVIQRVALIGGELSALGRVLESPSEIVVQRIEGLREELHDLAEEVRAMARRAHPAVLDHLGLPKALQALAADMSVSDDLAVEVEIDPTLDMVGVSQPAALSLFRVGQEGLRNVARHARVSAATIRLATQGAGVSLEVRDQGVGLGPDGSLRNGLGLLSLGERLRSVQGTFTVTSPPGGGTTVCAWVPRKGEG